jgi:hypothetical protein
MVLASSPTRSTCVSRQDGSGRTVTMNGFDIKYDRWYFDLFAYSSYSPNVDDTEWLCDWHSDNWR